VPRRSLSDARLYVCVDARARQGDLSDFLDAVLESGVDIVQLRQKGIEARQELAALEVFAAACQRHGALLAVNDRADVAWACGAPILHLGQDDLPVSVARALVTDDVLIGRSSHTESEAAAAAAEEGVDYFCVGPCWPTPTKPGRPAPGLDLVRYASTLGTDRPWFAIGGIDLDNLDEVLDAGARRVVVVRAITEAADPGAAAREFAARLSQAVPVP
jgi:thiamine-phosphate pyrophosphorylase